MEWPAIVLGILTILIGGGGIAALVTARSSSAKTLVEAQGIALKNLQGEVGRMADRMTAMGGELTQLRTDGAQLRTDLTAVSFRAQRAETHAASIHDWIDGGMEPPPPTRPAWLPVGRRGLAATSTTSPSERTDP